MKNVIKETQELLSKNTEWIERYVGYAEKILDNKELGQYRKNFNESDHLHFYINTTQATTTRKDKELKLDVRCFGQSVAELTARKDDIYITTDGKDKNNQDYFKCNITLDKNVRWRDEKATEFRSFFSEITKQSDNIIKIKSEEFKVQNILLKEFSKKEWENKPIINIQPVRVHGVWFGMPTPLSASDHECLSYANHNGGNIDILARTGLGSISNCLTVIEVKDENLKKEPPRIVLKQAMHYAVFIRELLRSKSGDNWYKILGYSNEMPKKLKIRVACAMPYEDESEIDTSFREDTYEIENDILECHYIYFKYDGENLSDFVTSLPFQDK